MTIIPAPTRIGKTSPHREFWTAPRKSIISTMVTYVLNERRYRHQQGIKMGGKA